MVLRVSMRSRAAGTRGGGGFADPHPAASMDSLCSIDAAFALVIWFASHRRAYLWCACSPRSSCVPTTSWFKMICGAKYRTFCRYVVTVGVTADATAPVVSAAPVVPLCRPVAVIRLLGRERALVEVPILIFRVPVRARRSLGIFVHWSLSAPALLHCLRAAARNLVPFAQSCTSVINC